MDYQQSSGESMGLDKPLALHDAHATIQYNLDNLKWLTINRRQILESGLGRASQLADSFADPIHISSDITVNVEQMNPPSLELLAWMLKVDIKEARLGPFVSDYFRHISEATLEKMGLSLIHGTGSPHDLIISTVCVNAMVSKFLTAISNARIDSELIYELTHTVVQFQLAAKLALQSISLLTTPSLGLLQALLSGIFLHQGSGDITTCWDLTKAACKVCISLGLDTIVKIGGALSEEQYYCLAWCYILDKNFSFKMGTSKSLLDIELPHITSGMSSHQHRTSDLFGIYTSLARVQATLLPYLRGRSLALAGGGLLYSHGMGEHLLVNMQQIQERIEHISCPYPAWNGLDTQSEISALQFAYHSIMTTIFNIFEDVENPAIDIRKQVALLHWTLLVYPITAYFVLFCNVVATSDTDDFKLMKTIVDCLNQIDTTSRPIFQVRTIFHHFLSLAGEIFDDESNSVVIAQGHQDYDIQSQSSASQHWLPDDLFLSSTGGTIPPFTPSFLDGINDFSDISIFPENEMLIPFGDDFPDLGSDHTI
ncbi:Transcription factor [Penicillium griseofulvum]|uniref:Transcription factor n=1 Tax=Penicillium patulum TaxID=5078 RepID=A0A135LN22_PENPA|nr:Transcription factor [Penicillium griseofulvum]KXG50367.1 Transcription factor [Penicillium griseofulvum]